MKNDNTNKVNVTDTVKDMTKNPKEALKRDYDQTKADMENMKDSVENKVSGKKLDMDDEVEGTI